MPRLLLQMSRVIIWILLLVFCCSACASPLNRTPSPGKIELGKTIYLVSHGWHAGIVLKHSAIPLDIQPVFADFPDTEYLEIGWGDREFYQEPDPHTGILLKAALLPTPSVLHILGFDGPVQAAFPHSEIISIKISSTALKLLSQSIAASFSRDKAGRIHSLGPGLYGNSRFYKSNESYHIFNTCNVWTARILQNVGLPVEPTFAVRVEALMSQVRQIGTVIQFTPKPSE